MNDACQAESPDGFGPDAKMATSQEFLDSPNAAIPEDADGAWIRPTVVAANADGVVDVSGTLGSGSLSCAGWNGSGAGLHVSVTGGISGRSCLVVLAQVACSAPAQ